MSDDQTLLIETADRLFADLAARRDEGSEALWPAIAEAGFTLLLVPEAEGGFGGSWSDACAVLRLAGYHALPLPLGEAVIAAWLASRGGLPQPEGVATLAPHAEGSLVGGFTGHLSAVPWGRQAATIVATLDGETFLVSVSDATKVEQRENTAGEPRDTLHFANARIMKIATAIDAQRLGALIRTAQIAGALDAALARAIDHANERIQFGKPIGKFQALQQNLAVFAEEAAAVNCAAPAAFAAVTDGDADFAIPAAKLRANMAVGVGTAIAHQVHGAIGFTREFGLHHLTNRLYAWRSEFGADRFWAERLGRKVAAAGAEAFWPGLTG
jgi:acyl-CoA dehydrogenase